MARTFSSGNYLAYSTAGIVTAMPITMAAWAKTTNTTTYQAMMGQVDVGGTDWHVLSTSSLTAGRVGASTGQTGVGQSYAESTSGITSGVWFHACAVFTSRTSRAAFLNGGNKGTNTVDLLPAAGANTTIGATTGGGGAWTGEIAEAAIWNVALTDEEVAALGRGVLPYLIRPSALAGYWPIYGLDSPERDFKPGIVTATRYAQTLTGTPAAANHAPVCRIFRASGADNTPQFLDPTTGTLLLAGNTPATSLTTAPSTGALLLAGNTPSVTQTIAPTTGTLSLAGNTPTIAVGGTVLSPTTGTLALVGNTTVVELSGGGGDAPTSYNTSGASFTAATPGGWLIFANTHWLIDDTVNDYLTAIGIDGGADYSEVDYEAEDTENESSRGTIAYLPLEVGNVARVRYRVSSPGHDCTRTAIFGIRLSVFESFWGVQSSNTITHSVVDTFQTFAQNSTFNLNTTGPLVGIGLPIHTTNEQTKSPYGRIQIGGADWPAAWGTNAPSTRDNGDDQKIGPILIGYNASVASGTLNVTFDAAENTDVTPSYNCTTQVAAVFSLKLSYGATVTVPAPSSIALGAQPPAVNIGVPVNIPSTAIVFAAAAPGIATGARVEPIAAPIAFSALAPTDVGAPGAATSISVPRTDFLFRAFGPQIVAATAFGPRSHLLDRHTRLIRIAAGVRGGGARLTGRGRRMSKNSIAQLIYSFGTTVPTEPPPLPSGAFIDCPLTSFVFGSTAPAVFSGTRLDVPAAQAFALSARAPQLVVPAGANIPVPAAAAINLSATAPAVYAGAVVQPPMQIISFTAMPPSIYAFVDEVMIPQHGQYSTSYLSDWSVLPNGKNYPRRVWSTIPLTTVNGPSIRQTFTSGSPTLRGLRYRTQWTGSNGSVGKYNAVVAWFKNCDTVTIDDCAIACDNDNWAQYHAFIFENCRNVIVKNSYFAGASIFQLRMEGCQNIFVHNCEFSGIQYGSGLKSGGGIYVNGGEVGKGYDFTQWYQVVFTVLQNCYFHDWTADGLSTGPASNCDAVNCTSPADGIMFNNYFENLISNVGGDASHDISHRRTASTGYTNHTFRVERNITRKNKVAKQSGGGGDPTTRVFYCNNIFLDTYMFDYHDGNPDEFVHNTFVASPTRTRSDIFNDNGMSGSTTAYWNSLVNAYNTALTNVHSGPDVAAITPADYNCYLMPTPTTFANGIGSFSAWQSSGRDTHGVLLGAQDPFVNRTGENFDLAAGSQPIGRGTNTYQTISSIERRVTKDFNGRVYANAPACGAYEFSGSSQTWNLVWSDEFNYSGAPDPTKWSIIVDGTFRNRAQNVRVENGNLVLEVRKDNAEGQTYTSGSVRTADPNSLTYMGTYGDKKYFAPGRIEARIKVNQVRGLMNSFWFISNWTNAGSFYTAGEIDMLEAVGYDTDKWYGTVHAHRWFNFPSGSRDDPSPVQTHPTVTGLENFYHIWAAEWDATAVKIFYDGTLVLTRTRAGDVADTYWPFTNNMALVLECGHKPNSYTSFGGEQGTDDTGLPAQMLIDYVRYYTK